MLNPKKLEYYPQLVAIRKELEILMIDFPLFKCDYTSRIVSKITGLEEVSGYFVPLESRHSWNYDPKRNLYVDLTQDQFEMGAGKIAITSKNNRALKKIRKHTNKQKREKFRSIDDPHIDELVRVIELKLK